MEPAIIGAIIIASAALSAPIIAHLLSKRRERLEQAQQAALPEPASAAPAPPTRQNIVMILGRSGVGKSQLIETMTKAKPEVITEGTQTFRVDEHVHQGVRLLLGDYRGQDIGQFIRNFMQNTATQQEYAYGAVNTLILIVDLFRYDPTEEITAKHPTIDAERVAAHLEMWTQTQLDTIISLLTSETLNYVCLFINKIDKWSRGGKRKNDRAKHQYRTLIEALKQRLGVDSNKFEVIVGSAFDGTGVIGPEGLLSRLVTHSVALQ